MATFRPELFTIEEVVNFYENANGESYKIFAGSNPTEAYCRYHFNGDKEIGIQELTAALVQVRSNSENFNPYLIQVISAGKGKIKETLTSITFQLNRPAAYMPMQMQQNNNGRTEMLLEKLLEQNNQLVSRVTALEVDDFEEEPETGLSGMLNNPEIQSMLIGAIGRFIGGNPAQPGAIAGIKTECDYSDAIEILESLMHKGVTLEHLKALDKMSATKLKSLLIML